MQNENKLLTYRQNTLYIDKISLQDVAGEFGTPTYVYDRQTITKNWLAFDQAFGDVPHQICYAVKANSNLAILNVLHRLGSSFDIISLGELERVLAAKAQPQQIVFSGVGKSKDEIAKALDYGIYCFNVESEAELMQLASIAQDKNKIASVTLRINPNIDARTHPYIATGLKENKFGIEMSETLRLCKAIQHMPSLRLIGLGCHIGSQIAELDPFMEAADCLLALLDQVTALGFMLELVNVGGGLGVCYIDEKTIPVADYVQAIKSKFLHKNVKIVIEPGRAIVANAGVLLTRVEYLKETAYKNFAIVDAGMNDLIRPALYDAKHAFLPVTQHTDRLARNYDIVGPVCETGDFLGKELMLALAPGDLIAINSAGAYGFSMGSNYNSRLRPAEVLIDNNNMLLIREREAYADLFAKEKIPLF